MALLSLPAGAQYLGPLVGHWAGEGQGLWAADSPFRYREEVTFTVTGKPFLHYVQRSWGIENNQPLHTETGYLRATGDGGVEMLIAQPTGFAEIHTGTLSESVLSLALTSLIRTPTALSISELQRQFFFEADTLTYLVRIAMNGEPLADHLRGKLRRESRD